MTNIVASATKYDQTCNDKFYKLQALTMGDFMLTLLLSLSLGLMPSADTHMEQGAQTDHNSLASAQAHLNTTRLRAHLNEALDEVPGALLLVQTPDQEFFEAVGLADTRENLAFPLDASLRVGSVSKLYTASVVLMLADEGAIDLDAPLSTYLPADLIEGIGNADRASVRQALNHTSGIPDFVDTRSVALKDWSEPVSNDWIYSIVRNRRARHEPGESYSYSNTNYTLLGEVVEHVTGHSLGEEIQNRIFTPLGLEHSYYTTDGQNVPGDIIHGYGFPFRPNMDTYHLIEHVGADAGIMAAAPDVAIFMDALFRPDGQFRNIGQHMLADPVIISERRADGLGAEIFHSRNGAVVYGHTGDVWGYLTFAGYIKDYDAVFVIHINKDEEDTLIGLMRGIMDSFTAE